MNYKSDIIIIGTGLTGLTAAYYLVKAGYNVKLIEKKDRIGGVINTITENGFIFETGPNSGILSTIEAVELFEELSEKCNLEVANKESKARWIWKNGQWNPLPSGLMSAIKTPLFTLKDKLGIIAEPFRPKGTNPEESIAEMVVRRLGRSFLDYAIDPFISGIYAGNPQKLITKYAMPKLYNLEQNYGSFIKGAIKKKKENASIPAMKKVTKEVFSTELGLHNLVQSLVKCIGAENFELNASDIVVNSQSKPYTVTFEQKGLPITYNSEYVISTTAAHVLPLVFTDLPQDKLSKISNLEYAKVVQVVLGFTNWRGIELKSFGGLVPTVEKRNILGVLFISSIFRNRAPEGGALLSVFLGGMKRSDIIEMSDEEIMKIVKEELKLMLKTNTDEADLVKILRYSKAIPQYEISSGERFKAIDEIQNEYAGIILAGNIRNGIGMSDRIAQGRQIADEIINKGKI